METLGVDFDGVLRKWPYFVAPYANFICPTDLLVRARLYWLRKLLCRFLFEYTPIILDGKMIDSINEWDGRIIVITGRATQKKLFQAYEQLDGKLKFHLMYGRIGTDESEEEFKLKVMKKERVTLFIEDRDFVIEFLRKHGMEVASVKEVRKCFRK